VIVEVADTELVVIEKVTELLLAGTVTVAGTVAYLLLEDSEIAKPPNPAFPSSETVPVAVLPPATEPGRMVRPEKVAGTNVTAAV
jgi:hypothetical protein